MTAPLTLRWRAIRSGPTIGWAGPAVRPRSGQAAAAVIGPRGPRGETGLPGQAPTRIDASLSSAWILPNPLGRIPTVEVFLGSGERVLTDVEADANQITVVFPTPQQGFVLVF